MNPISRALDAIARLCRQVLLGVAWFSVFHPRTVLLLVLVTTVAAGVSPSDTGPLNDMLFTTVLPKRISSTGSFAGATCGDPPLITTREQVDEMVEILETAVAQELRQ